MCGSRWGRWLVGDGWNIGNAEVRRKRHIIEEVTPLQTL
jgi:hypothetical protein